MELLKKEDLMEAKNNSNGNEKIVTISELREIVELQPEGKLLQIEFIDTENVKIGELKELVEALPEGKLLEIELNCYGG